VQDGAAVVAFMPSKPGSIAYSCPSLSGRVVVYDFRIASVLYTVDLPQVVCSLATSSQTGVVAAGGCGGSVFLIDEVVTHEFKGHLHPAQGVAFGLQGTLVVSAAGTSMYLWNC
jgi:WD40 repeat protein